jgi:small subunit ribosomal protein S1
MGAASDDQAYAFLASLRVGDLCGGTVAEVSRRGVSVTLDGFPARPLGSVGPLDLSWRQFRSEDADVGRRITAAVIGIEWDRGQALLSMAAAEYPQLWAFLASLRAGDVLTGEIAAIERFGVFVALDDGPDHPLFPGVGFITIPELSWRHFEAVSDIVRVGQRVSCGFLGFDTTNGEARLSLRATQPDPFQTLADRTVLGQRLRGRVTKLVPFGVFVEVIDGLQGLVPLEELAWTPVGAPEDIVAVGDEMTVVVTDIDRDRRRLTLSRRQASPS